MTKLLTPEHYQGMGEVIVVWARLESHVFKVLHTLTRMRWNEALVVYWQMGFSERLKVLNDLIAARYPSKDDDLRKKFIELYNRIERAYRDRNVVAHSIWFRGDATNEISPFVFDPKGRKNKSQSFNAQTFHKQALAMDRLAEDFKDFFSTYFRVRFIHKKQATLD